jgi:hypothetical protein
MIFATLIASAGTFFYKKYQDNLLLEEHSKLYESIKVFSEANMKKVLDYDRRLQQANNRFDNSISIASILVALEAATADTVKIETLDFERQLDDKVILSAEIKTDNFDSTIFQRGTYEGNGILQSVVIDSLNTASIDGNISDTTGEQVESSKFVSFLATIEVPLSEVPYTGDDIQSSVQITQPVTETQPSVSDIGNNNSTN